MSGCEALIKAIDAYLAKADDDLAEALNEAGFVAPEETVEEIESLEEQLAAALKKQTKYVQSKLKSVVDLETFAKNWPGIKESDYTDEKLAQIFLDDFTTNIPNLATAYVKVIDPKLTVTTITERTTAWAASWSEELGSLMKLNSHDEIEKLLTDNLKAGKSVADFSQALIDSGIRDEQYKARRAALTETLRAHSVAQQEAIVQNPAVEGKEWVHTGSHRNEPRENHVAMSGVIVPKDEPFELEGLDGVTYYPMYPRDSILPPGESINCHCIHRGIVNEDILGLPLEERQRLQQAAIDADDGEWEKELDAKNKARAGIED